MVMFTAEQRSELRDAFARSRLEAEQESRRLARASQAARSSRRRKPPAPAPSKPPAPAPPKTAVLPPPTTAERHLADQLLAHICAESVVDRDRHAVCVARTVLAARRANTTTFTREET